MKSLKDLALAALVVGGLLLPLAATRAQSASADCDPNISLGGCEQHVINPIECTAGNVVVTVDVTASHSLHNYAYDLNCSHLLAIKVSSTYDVSAKTASENLSMATGDLSATWVCASDPWSRTTPLKCSGADITALTGKGFGSFVLRPEETTPFSLLFLNPQAHTVFAAQLQNAFDHPSTYTPGNAFEHSSIPTPVQATDVIAGTAIAREGSKCLVCTAMVPPSPPTQPDFQAPTLGGDSNLAQGITSIYSIGVNNAGTRPQTQVQVSIQVTGSVEYVSMEQTPACH